MNVTKHVFVGLIRLARSYGHGWGSFAAPSMPHVEGEPDDEAAYWAWEAQAPFLSWEEHDGSWETMVASVEAAMGEYENEYPNTPFGAGLRPHTSHVSGRGSIQWYAGPPGEITVEVWRGFPSDHPPLGLTHGGPTGYPVGRVTARDGVVVQVDLDLTPVTGLLPRHYNELSGLARCISTGEDPISLDILLWGPTPAERRPHLAVVTPASREDDGYYPYLREDAAFMAASEWLDEMWAEEEAARVAAEARAEEALKTPPGGIPNLG